MFAMGSATCRQSSVIRDLQGGEGEKGQRRKNGKKDYGARSPYPRLPISSCELHDYITPMILFWELWALLCVERRNHRATNRTGKNAPSLQRMQASFAGRQLMARAVWTRAHQDSAEPRRTASGRCAYTRESSGGPRSCMDRSSPIPAQESIGALSAAQITSATKRDAEV